MFYVLGNTETFQFYTSPYLYYSKKIDLPARLLHTHQTNMERHISLMRTARNQLLCIPPSDQSPEYSAIFQSIQDYLRTQCRHNIVEDLIDIHPECSQTIYYCEYCEITFDYKAYAYAKNKQ